MSTPVKIFKVFILSILSQTFLLNSYSQINDESILTDPVQTNPVFSGGEKQLFCFLDKTLNKAILKFPDTSGVVIAQFTIDKKGIVKDINIIRPLNQFIDNEFLRVIQLMPKWIPARKSNKPFSTKLKLPLRIPYENKFCR